MQPRDRATSWSVLSTITVRAPDVYTLDDSKVNEERRKTPSAMIAVKLEL
jgi:hypothetical protein